MLFNGDIREYWREEEQEKRVNLDFIEGRQSHSGFVWIFLKSDWTLLLPQAIAPYNPVLVPCVLVSFFRSLMVCLTLVSLGVSTTCAGLPQIFGL